MNLTKKSFNIALSSALLSSSSLLAADLTDIHLKSSKKMDKCYCIAKSGKNDCSDRAGKHNCAGAKFQDGDCNEWILLPKGICHKITGGKIEKDFPSKG